MVCPPVASGDLHELARIVRFMVPLAGSKSYGSLNTFASSPAADGLGLFVELEVRCAGRPDATTGYLVDIGAIDRLIRRQVAPLLATALETGESLPAPAFLGRSLAALATLSPPVRSVALDLTPFLRIEMESANMTRVLLRQRFEFAAAHRLHCPELSAERNRELFGKCNNPNGHGHNYRIEVAAAVSIDARTGMPAVGVDRLEEIVHEQVIARFDHKHLNLDTTEFASLNPSVENIATVCHRLLQAPLANVGAELRTVTVWETGKTSCTYPA
ncbi:MAG: 6-carboxytetrahydropterin synthase [Phycisphaerales bacterium]|nr:6-carboxytetrahydropterin synthase [Phycisphaerales bacterium]